MALFNISLSFASTPLVCPTAEQLSNLKVAGEIIPKVYYSNPGLTSTKQCSIALLIVAPSKELAQVALGKAVLFRSEPKQGTTACFYDKVPGQEKIGLITVMTYPSINGSCTSKPETGLRYKQIPQSVLEYVK